MHNPSFYIAKVTRGSIDRDPSYYTEKCIRCYELEFYTKDYPGGNITDGVFHPATKGGFCIFKPGQLQTLVPPYQCYVMNLYTDDPELTAQLNAIPTFSMLWNMDEVIRLLQQMIPLGKQTTLQSQLRLHSYAGQILSLLTESNQMPGRKDLNTLRHQDVLLAADQYIREHLSEDLSLNRLAMQSNLDPTYFHKLFTAAFGTTPAKQVLNHRIAAVKAGLLDDTISRRALALQCGFSSASYMGVKFRQITGMSPSQYRKETLQQR